MNNAAFATLSLCVLVGCASGPGNVAATSEPGADPSVSDGEDEAEVATVAAEASPERTVLPRGLHHTRMTEVALDAAGRAALTLDDFGGLRLWPDVTATDGALPIILPEIESSWFSLARAGDDAFVVATLDTAGGARVARIELVDGVARRIGLFELPATDPQFEIHALEGGERILALGKDHRVRLFDSTGKVVSEIDERGFIPWQLRVVQTPGQPARLAAVLTQPVRAQALTIDGDVLRTVGDPWMVALDQSPNRNELALSPDGTHVAALRRHGKRGKGGFALQLIELATGTRRVIVGEIDTKARPRLHYASNDRVLLESGSGKGFWIELAQAVPRDATTFPPAVMQTVSLPDALGDLRMQVAESGGVRAIATDDVLTIDPLGNDDHLRFTRQSLAPYVLALDAKGGLLAWAHGTHVFVDDTTAAGPAPVGFDVGATVHAIAFDEDGNLVLDAGGKAQVRGRDGALVTTSGTVAAPPRWDFTASERDAKRATAGLELHGRLPMHAIAAPSGSRLAVGRSAATLGLGDRPVPPLALDVFDRDDGHRLWSRPLGDLRPIAWSGDARRIATWDGTELLVLDAQTGARTFARYPARLVVEASSDAPVVATAR
jgi:hypothetical protein